MGSRAVGRGPGAGKACTPDGVPRTRAVPSATGPQGVHTVSTSSVVLSAVLLAVTLAVAVPLARSAAYRFSVERAGRPYELAEDYRAARLRATASVAVLCTGAVLAATLPGVRSGTVPQGAAVAAPAPPPAHAAGRGTWTGLRRQAPRRTPEPAPRTLALPAGGILRLLADGTRVWLPPQYTSPSGRHRTFPLVVAYLPVIAADREELYPAFARYTAAGKADPFVVVEPRDCSADPAHAVAAAVRHYRVVRGRQARAVLGVGAAAPCAVRVALAHPGLFRAAVGISGRYASEGYGGFGASGSGGYGASGSGGYGAGVDAGRAPRLRVLLVVGAGERGPRDSALRLRAALRHKGVRVRIVDGVTAGDGLGGGERRHELALAAQYLTEQLAGPGTTSLRRAGPGTTPSRR